jgi:hypothetical protein
VARPVKRVDFYKLERPVQERFVEATRGQGVGPLLIGKLPLPFDAIGWGVGAAALLLVWAYVASRGFDDLESPLALQPGWMLGVHVALPMLAVVCGLMSTRALKQHARLPFVQTTYLFPIGVIDARAQELHVHTLEELTRHEIKNGTARFEFKDGRFEFPIAAGPAAAELEQRVSDLKSKLGQGVLPDRELVLLDPLRDNGFRNPFSPAESMRPPKPKRIPVVAPILFGVAALSGLGVYTARNALGERAIYAQARQRDSVEGYRAYLARGGERTEVVDLLLPRAELRQVTATKSVDAVEAYMASHKGSKIQTEVDAALRAALLLALEDTKKKNTITAFRAFEQRYKAHLDQVPELAHARFAYLSGVLERFQKEFKPSTELWQLARRLIVHADKHGPKVAIRFSQRESRTLEKNEHQLQASAYYGGEKTLPSKVLIGEEVRKAERIAAADLAKGFAKILPDDLVHFELGPPVDPAAPEPTFTEPTLLVGYRLEISSTFVTKRPRGIFTGVGLLGDVTLSIPDKQAPYKVKHTAWHIPDVRRIESEELAVDAIYPELLAKAFAKLTTRYLAPWLGKE